MIVIWDIYNRKVKLNLQGHSTSITSMSMRPQNQNNSYKLSSASADGKIKIWDLSCQTSVINLKGHFSQIDALSFSPDLNYLASGSQDGVIKLWDLRTNKCIKEIYDKEQKSIYCIEFNNYEKAFAYGGKDKILRYYNYEKFEKIGQTSADRLPIQKLAFDNKGKNIFSATNESLKYWEINEQGLNLNDMFETGWNKLQSFKYLEGKAICGLSTYGDKISYYLLKNKDMFKTPNNILNKKFDMEKIFEVHESEDSSIMDTKKKETNNKMETKNEENFKKNDIIPNLDKNAECKGENNILGFSKLINDNDISISLNDISSSKIENDSLFIKNTMKMIEKDNFSEIKKEIGKKEKNDNLEEKNETNQKNEIKIAPQIPQIDEQIDEQIDQFILGDISNLSDTENKGELSLSTIIGNTKIIKNEIITKNEN